MPSPPGNQIVLYSIKEKGPFDALTFQGQNKIEAFFYKLCIIYFFIYINEYIFKKFRKYISHV